MRQHQGYYPSGMNDQVARCLGGVGIVCFTVAGWRALQPAQQSAAEPSTEAAPASVPATAKSKGRDGEPADEKRSVASVRGGSEPLVKEKALAEKLHVQLISTESGTLAVNGATIAMLGLSPNQAHQLNASLGKFFNRLRDEEVKHAYVTVSADGSEEIVVPAFDRKELIDALMTELDESLGPAIADFVNDRLLYDWNLAAGNFEMRSYIQKGNDGKDREVFERTTASKPQPIKLPGMSPERTVFSAPTQKNRTNIPLRDDHYFRARHLWAAIYQLPRRDPETGSKER